MGNAFSRDGVITRIVEAIPGGGLITAPIHAIAGNKLHAIQAATTGIVTVAVPGAQTIKTIGNFIKDIGHSGYPSENDDGPSDKIANNNTDRLEKILNELELKGDKKDKPRKEAKDGNYDKAAEYLIETVREKMVDNSRQLSAESGGRRCLKSVHGTFLRAYDSDWKVDMTPGPARAWEHWYIEDWHGKVVFKAIHSPGRFLRAHPDGRVDLVDRPQTWEIWVPLKNNDGSWSFLSAHGKWLSACQDGSVSTVIRCDTWEHFWLDRW